MNQEIMKKLLTTSQPAPGSPPPMMAVSPAAAITGTATPLAGSLARKYNKQLEKSKKLREQYRDLKEKTANPDEKVLFHKGSIYVKRKVGYDRIENNKWKFNKWKYEYKPPLGLRFVPFVGTALAAFRPRSLDERLSRLEGKNAKTIERRLRLMQGSVKARVGKDVWNEAKANVKAERVAAMAEKHHGYEFGPTTFSNVGVQLGVVYKTIFNREGYRAKIAERAESAKNATLQKMFNIVQAKQVDLDKQSARIQGLEADLGRLNIKGLSPRAIRAQYERSLKAYGTKLESVAAVFRHAEPRVRLEGTETGPQVLPASGASKGFKNYLSYVRPNKIMAELPGRYEDKSMAGLLSRSVKLTYAAKKRLPPYVGKWW
jgi:hypothetical protein